MAESSSSAKSGGVKLSFKLGPKVKVALFLITLWAVQAFYVYSVNQTLLTPDVWASWWIARIGEVIRGLDSFWKTRQS